MADTEKTILEIGLEVNSRDANREFQKFTREATRHIKGVEKGLKDVEKGNKKVSKAAMLWKESYGEVADEIKTLQKRLHTMAGEEHRDAKKQIKHLKNVRQLMKDARKGGVSPFDARQMATEAKKAMEDAAGAFKSSISSFFSKDLKGSVEGLSGLFGKGLLAAVAKGGTLQAKGAAMAKGGGMGGKMMGGAMAQMGGALKSIAKIAPALTTIGSIMMKVVTMMIDAESAAKDFNKSILQSASTAEFLADNAGDADLAFEDMEKTMKALYKAATSLDNLDWGISAEEHKAVLNTLTQEGVTLRRMASEAEKHKGGMEAYAAQLTQVSVAYSRAFGQPLNEINQLQAEMMTDLGMSLEDTRQSFSMMTRAATESGIASNKFFAMIRGVSQDLSLYNNRMEDAVKLLGMLGKVMNPRNAAKFHQTAMQGLKGMGRMQRVQVSLLSAPGDIVAKAQEQRYRDLGKMLKMNAQDVQKILTTQGTKGLEPMIQKLEDTQQGAAREMALTTEITGREGRAGVVGQSGAIAELGPGGAAEVMARAVTSIGGGFGSLKDAMHGMGVKMTAEMLGVSREELKGYAQLEYAVNLQKDTLQKQLEAGGAERAKALHALEKANLKEGELATAGWDAVIKTMGENQQQAIEEEQKAMTPMEKMAKEQGHLTESLLGKLSVLVDFIMSQIYSIMTSIWDSIQKLPGLGPDKEETEARDIELMAKRMGEDVAGKKELMDALKATAGMKASERLKELRPIVKKIREESFAARGQLPSGEELMKQYQQSPQERSEMAVQNLKQGNITELSKALKLSADQEEKLMALQLKIQDRAREGATKEELVKEFGPKATAVMDAISQKFSAKQTKGRGDLGLPPGATPMLPTGPTPPLSVLGPGGQVPDKYSSLSQSQKDDLWSSEKKHYGGGFKGAEKASARRREREKTDKVFIDQNESLITNMNDTKMGIIDLNDVLSKPNTAYFKFPSSFLKGPFKKTMEDALMKSLRTALFEFYLLSEVEDREKALEYMQTQNLSIHDFMKGIGKAAKGEDPKTAAALMGVEDTEEGAFGAYITGVTRGIAKTRDLAAGGLMRVHPGEMVGSPNALRGTLGMAGGGGGGRVVIQLAGDAGRLFDARIDNRIAEDKRRSRYS